MVVQGFLRRLRGGGRDARRIRSYPLPRAGFSRIRRPVGRLSVRCMESKALTLVVGYDGSSNARAAVEYGAWLAGPDGKIYVVHAYGPPHDWLGFPNYQRVLDDHRTRGQAVLDELPGDDPRVETELLEGPAVDAIIAVADTRSADLIVVGSRGGGRARATLGSVSHDLLHRAKRPVLVLPVASEPPA